MEKVLKLKKVTFALPEPLLEKLRTLAKNNRISSANAAVREALEDYIANIEREDFRQALEHAANDPEFIRDITDTEAAFQSADDETARMMPEW